MSDQLEKQALSDGPVSAPVLAPAPRQNRGWFGKGDRRINREGRPPKPNPLPPGTDPADCARKTDRVKRLVLPAAELAWRLAYPNGFWLPNLPEDAEIVASRVDSGTVVLTLRSEHFPRVARGELIPEFKADFNGLKWRRDHRWWPANH